MIWIDDGWQHRMLSGPSHFEAWRKAWRVFRTAAISLRIASPAALDLYEAGIRVLSVSYSQAWGVILRADETMRTEQWELIQEEWSESFTPQELWSSIIAASAYSDDGTMNHWWFTHVVSPILAPPPGGFGEAVVDAVEDLPRSQAQPARGVHTPQVVIPSAPGRGHKARRAAKAKEPARQAAERNWQSGPSAQAARPVERCFNWSRGGCKDPCLHGRDHVWYGCGVKYRAKDSEACKAKMPERPGPPRA